MLPDTDLFGAPLIEKAKFTASGKSKRDETPRGYAAPPGTGPKGETCKSCRFFTRHSLAKTYFKCGLMHRIWTCSYKSDIRANSPACAKWSMPNPVEWIREPIFPYKPLHTKKQLAKIREKLRALS